MKVKFKKCKICGSDFKPKYLTTERFCSFKCANKDVKSPKKKFSRIKPMSAKRKKEKALYLKKRIEFLEKPENKICFIRTCNKPATTVEHRAGRVGYADDYARENGITLYLDERYWAPCCLHHNLELENNPELSKEYQLSKIHLGKKL